MLKSIKTVLICTICVSLQKNNSPYVEYTSNVEEDVTQHVQNQQSTIVTSASDMPSAAPQQSRAVAKKSTTKRQSNVDSTTYNPVMETKPSHSIVVSKLHDEVSILIN